MRPHQRGAVATKTSTRTWTPRSIVPGPRRQRASDGQRRRPSDGRDPDSVTLGRAVQADDPEGDVSYAHSMAALRCFILICTTLSLLSCASTSTTITDERASASSRQLRYREVHSQEPGDPPKAMVVAAMHKVKADVMRCFDRYKQLGMVRTCLDVAADGSVEHSGIEGDLVGTDQAGCIAAAVLSAKFEPQPAPWSLKYPFIFR